MGSFVGESMTGSSSSSNNNRTGAAVNVAGEGGVGQDAVACTAELAYSEQQQQEQPTASAIAGPKNEEEGGLRSSTSTGRVKVTAAADGEQQQQSEVPVSKGRGVVLEPVEVMVAGGAVPAVLHFQQQHEQQEGKSHYLEHNGRGTSWGCSCGGDRHSGERRIESGSCPNTALHDELDLCYTQLKAH
jgi:hypothetical protein